MSRRVEQPRRSGLRAWGKRHLVMLALLAVLAAVEVLALDRLVLVARLEALLWIGVAALVVLSLRLIEARAGRAATSVGDVREVRDTVRRVAGSVGRLSRQQGEAEQGPTRSAGAAPAPAGAGAAPAPAGAPAGRPSAPPATAAPAARDEAQSTSPPDGQDLHLHYGRHTAPALQSEQEWQSIAGWLPTEPTAAPAGALAVLAPLETLRRLRAVAPVRSLMPGYGLGTLERTSPRLVVLDRAALAQGAWLGTETPAGFDLFTEVCDVASWAKERSIPVYWLDGPAPDAPNTAVLRGLASVVLPRDAELLEPWGAPASAAVSLLHALTSERLDREVAAS